MIGNQERSILVKDLLSFLKRPGAKSLWDEAIRDLNSFRQQAGLPTVGNYKPVSFISYEPDADIESINAANAEARTNSFSIGEQPVKRTPIEYIFGGVCIAGASYYLWKKWF